MAELTAAEKEQQERDAEYFAGAVIAGRSAQRRAASDEYNHPLNLAARIENSVAVDQRARDALEYLREGQPDVQGDDLESEIMKRAILRKMREDEGGEVTPEPRADGLDVVAEQVANGEGIDNPKLTDRNAGDSKPQRASKAKATHTPPKPQSEGSGRSSADSDSHA